MDKYTRKDYIKNMTIIITMAGMGSRFKRAGYLMPKFEIMVKGKTLFEWSLDSLLGYEKYVQKIIFIVRKADDAKQFIIEKCSKYNYGTIEIVEIDKLTDGQATTAMLGIEYCDSENPIMIYNIDTYVEPYELKYECLTGDGHIPCFHAPGTHWSFVKLDEDNQVVEVKEKERISDNCSLGAYYFSSANLYRQLYEEYYKDNTKMEINEKYIAPLYNLMVGKGQTVTMSIIDEKKVHVLGTPEELIQFINN